MLPRFHGIHAPVMLATLAAMVGSAAAQTDYASAQTSAQVSGVGLPTEDLAACGFSSTHGTLIASSGDRACSAGSAYSSPRVEVSATATAPVPGCVPGPTTTCELAKLRSKARIDVAVGSPSTYSQTLATALARFADYLPLQSQRPHSMKFKFELSGNLDLRPGTSRGSLDSYALVDVSVYAQSGIRYPSGVFASPSLSRYGQGMSSAQKRIDWYDSLFTVDPPISVRPITFASPNANTAPSDFKLVETLPGIYELTLGAPFFDNLDNSHVLLEFALFTQTALSPLSASVIASDLRSVSDFANTLVMTDVRAYDSAGNDITAQAFAGFDSARALGSIHISPQGATISTGASQAYTAQALSASSGSLGDVTAATVFTISPDGSCNGAVCTATLPGRHTVFGTYGGKTAAATLDVGGTTTPVMFQGFFQPIDMSQPSLIVWNALKAGQVVPVKWLLELNGAPVSDPATFVGMSSYPVACTSGAGTTDDALEETAAGKSGLQYLGSGHWQFNWQTSQSYKGRCRAAVVSFSDGTTSPAAYFKFK